MNNNTKNYTYISHDILNQLTNDELLIYCYSTVQACASYLNEFKFSNNILNCDLNVQNRSQKNRIKIALEGLISKGLISNPSNDYYIANATMKPENKDTYYLVMYKIEVDTLKAIKENSSILQYFCFLVSKFDNKTQQWELATSYIEKGFKEFFFTNGITISKPTIIKYNKILQDLNLIEVIKQNKEGKNDSNIIKRVNVSEVYKQSTKGNPKTAETNNLSIAKENEIEAATPKENNNNFDKDNLKSMITDIIDVKESEWELSNIALDKAKEIGFDNFIKIVNSCFRKHLYVFTSEKFKELDTKHKVNIVISQIIKKDLDNELKSLKKQEEKLKDDYFLKHKTIENCYLDKAGLNQIIDDSSLNYDKVIKQLENQSFIITDEVLSYIKDYIPKEIKRRQEEHQHYLDMQDYYAEAKY